MGIRKRLRRFREWCPQPPDRLPAKLKQYSVPIAVLLTVTLFVASFSIFYSIGVFRPAPQVPALPILNVPSSTSSSVSSVAPAVEWQKVLSGDLGISATCIIQTSDGGYAVGGDCDYKTGAPGYLVKLDSSGNMQWNQSYIKYAASKFGDNIQALVQTSDKGYAFLLGGTALTKTNSEGKVQWNITFSGAASSMVQTSDGGYVIAGYVSTAQIQNGRYDTLFWVAKVNSAGKLLWTNSFGGVGISQASSVVQTSDGGYALAGETNTFSVNGESEFWLVKTDSAGNVQWSKPFGSSIGGSEANSIVQTSDGGYVLAGSVAYGSGNSAGSDVWLVKTDSSGNTMWNRTYGGVAVMADSSENVSQNFVTGSGISDDYANCVIQTSDGGLAFVGQASNLVWLVKTDASGNPQWNETYGDSFFPDNTWAGNSIIETSDGAFAMAGYDQPQGEPWFGSYVIIKTEPVLAPPTPSPSPSPIPSSSTSPSPSQLFAFPTVTISSDGNVKPSTAPIQRNGNLYTFTGDLNGPLLIDKNNIVIDGADYTLLGNGTLNGLYIRTSQTGISLTGRSNVTIENLRIENYVDAVNIYSSRYITISGSNIARNTQGIYVSESTKTRISSNNIVTNNGQPIWLNSADNTLVSENIITPNMPSSNYAGIIIVSGTRNIIVGNVLENFSEGMQLAQPSNTTVAGNDLISNGEGLNLIDSTANNLIYLNNFVNDSSPTVLDDLGQSFNSWDNGTQGNYWSNYSTIYPNATELDSSGIGNTPYVLVEYEGSSSSKLDILNTDHYPLWAPVSNSQELAIDQTWEQAWALQQPSPAPTLSPLEIIAIVVLAVVVIAFVLALLISKRKRKPSNQQTVFVSDIRSAAACP
jgi:nitrous oxidase accessory protein NosD